jgi:hypothetical protein
MAPRKRSKGSKKTRDWLFPSTTPSPEAAGEESSLLDVVDRVLNKGAVLNGDVILGVANVDLVYTKLSVLLAAIDKIANDPAFKPVAAGPRRKRRRRRA